MTLWEMAIPTPKASPLAVRTDCIFLEQKKTRKELYSEGRQAPKEPSLV